METAKTLSEHVGVVKACRSLDVPRASYYRHFRSSHLKVVSGDHRKSPRGLSQEERQNVLDIMHSKRFVDVAPQEIYATLLDEGTYLCSVSTMYRILSENGEVRERRNQLRHPAYSKPELLATGPNICLVLGYYQAQGTCQMGAFQPLCHHGYLQPLRCGMDGCT